MGITKKRLSFAAFFIGLLMLCNIGYMIQIEYNTQPEYSYKVITSDNHYFLNVGDITYADNLLKIPLSAYVMNNDTTLNNSYFGVSFGYDIKDNAHIYVDGINRDSLIQYLPSKAGYEHIFYIPLNVLSDGWAKDAEIQITGFTGQEILNHVQNHKVMFFFGEATTVIKVVYGSGTDLIQVKTDRIYANVSDGGVVEKLTYIYDPTKAWLTDQGLPYADEGTFSSIATGINCYASVNWSFWKQVTCYNGTGAGDIAEIRHDFYEGVDFWDTYTVKPDNKISTTAGGQHLAPFWFTDIEGDVGNLRVMVDTNTAFYTAQGWSGEISLSQGWVAAFNSTNSERGLYCLFNMSDVDFYKTVLEHAGPALKFTTTAPRGTNYKLRYSMIDGIGNSAATAALKGDRAWMSYELEPKTTVSAGDQLNKSNPVIVFDLNNDNYITILIQPYNETLSEHYNIPIYAGFENNFTDVYIWENATNQECRFTWNAAQDNYTTTLSCAMAEYITNITRSDNHGVAVSMTGYNFSGTGAETVNITILNMSISGDVTPPDVATLSPINNTVYYSPALIPLVFEVNDSVSIDFCELHMNTSGTLQYYKKITGVSNNTETTTYPNTTLSDGSYLWNINCSDGVGNWAFGENKIFRIFLAGLNVSLYSAENNTAETPFNLFATNGTYSSYNASITNPTVIYLWNLPHGDTNITLSKAGYENVTYNVTINTSGIFQKSGYTIPSSIGVFNLTAPLNNSVSINLNIPVTITTPTYITTPFNFYYSLNGGAWTALCTSCSNYSGTINTVTYGEHNLTVNSTSEHYNPHDIKNVYFNNSFSAYTILLKDEKTGDDFNVSITNSTELYVYCLNQTTNHTFSTHTMDISPTCNVTSMKVLASFNGNTYYRKLVPESINGTITFYLFDYDEITSVELSLIIADLTGDFEDAIIKLDKIIGTETVHIHQEEIDIENKILAYLIKDDTYNLRISNAETERVIGNIIIDSDTSKSITLGFSLSPNITMIYNTIQYGIITNNNTNTIQLNYSDASNRTVSVDFWILNQSNESQIFYHGYSTNTSNILFTWNSADLNNTYIGRMTVNHGLFNIFTQDFVIGFVNEKIPVEFISKKWLYTASMFILICIALTVTAYHVTAGIILVLLSAGFMRWVGWLPIPSVVWWFLVLIAAAGILIKRRGN